jgi:hypothetical protein
MTITGTRAVMLTVLFTGVALAGLACSGSIGEGGGPGSDPTSTDPSNTGSGGHKTGGTGAAGSNGGSPDPVPTPDPQPVTPQNSAGSAVFRRMTAVEYKNTVRDLLGVSPTATADLQLQPDTSLDIGFAIGAPFVTQTDSAGLYAATDKLTSSLLTNMAGLAPKSCDLGATAAAAQQACAGDFIDQFGLRAFRRPVNADEKQDLLDLFNSFMAPTGGATFTEGLAGLVQAMLQTPMFLYRWELGVPALKDGDLVRYNSYETASRLSYYLWASMPDEGLFQAAAADKLMDPGDIAAQARRMLADPRAKDALADFNVQWLDIVGVQGMQKDPSYTNYNATVAQAMYDETVAFTTSIYFGPQASGKLADLFTSPSSFVSAGLGKIYGVNVSGDTLSPTKLDGTQRAGIMTEGSFLAAHSDEDFSNPVHRGVITLRHIMCNQIPEPAGIDVPPLPPRMAGETTRQHFEKHSSVGGICSSCHSAIDPIGFAFENYDASGAYRTTEENKKVDASGTIPLGKGMVTFTDAVDLAKQLSTSTDVRECVTRHWMRYLLRREELQEEDGSVASVMGVFEKSNWDLREMLIASTTTHAFTHRKPIAGEATK